MFVIPFSLLPPPLLRRFSNLFMKYGDAMSKIFPYLQLELDNNLNIYYNFFSF